MLHGRMIPPAGRRLPCRPRLPTRARCANNSGGAGHPRQGVSSASSPERENWTRCRRRAASGHLVRAGTTLSRKFRTLSTHSVQAPVLESARVPVADRRDRAGSSRRAKRGSSRRNTSGRFQSHASMGPALRRRRTRGRTAPPWWDPARRSRNFARRRGRPARSGCRRNKVHGIWVPGPGSLRAQRRRRRRDRWRALLSKAVGRPVRVQGHALWRGTLGDPKGPALDSTAARRRPSTRNGCRDRLRPSRARAFRASTSTPTESEPEHQPCPASLMGLPLKSLQGFGVPAESYGFRQQAIGAWGDGGTPCLDRGPRHCATAPSARPGRPRRSNSPANPLSTEIAAAGGAPDPVAFRLALSEGTARQSPLVKAAGRACRMAAAPLAAGRTANGGQP